MAALHASFLDAGLTVGDVVVASQDVYGASLTLLEQIFGPFGVKTELADFSDIESLRRKCEETSPRFLLAETISNPLLKVCDITAVARAAHDVEAQLIVDSTFATPYLARPIENGADFVVHSATKYLGGHGDAIGGVVVLRDAVHEARLDKTMKLTGGVLSVWEADRILRGIKTLALRMERQCANAAKLAEWLRGRSEISAVHYPGLGAIVSLVLADDKRESAWAFMDSLKLIVRATTLGDVHTSVSHSATSSHREFSPERRAELGISEGLVRVSVGVEGIDDLIADIEHAL
jgi:cystathionine beta-lyase/cystathionine gamma-synthase